MYARNGKVYVKVVVQTVMKWTINMNELTEVYA